jgi:NYN domain
VIAFFIDADNFSSPAWIDEAFQTLEASEGTIAIRRAYGSAENLRGLADTLRIWAIRPFVNLALSKNTTDLSLAVDAMELAYQTPRPRIVVVGSGDVDFVPLVVRLRERGIKVICVSDRSKMAQDAVPAYDKVIYVGNIQCESLATTVENASPTVVAPLQSAHKKAAAKQPKTKATQPKAAPAKKAPTKKAATKTARAPIDKVSVQQILAAIPKLKIGEWLRLSEVAKPLHDEKLLAKSAASTKLFKKYPHHFELTPLKQPNQVRYIAT